MTFTIRSGPQLRRIRRWSNEKWSDERIHDTQGSFYLMRIATGVDKRSGELRVMGDFVLFEILENIFEFSECIYIGMICDRGVIMMLTVHLI